MENFFDKPIMIPTKQYKEKPAAVKVINANAAAIDTGTKGGGKEITFKGSKLP